MAIDYAAQDAAIDDEIRAMYAPEGESETTEEPESPAEAGTENEEQTESPSEEQDEHATGQEPPDEESATESDENNELDEAKEASVPESRYHNAVVAMNKAQQELADRRKQDAGRDSLISQLQTQVQQLLDEKQTAKPEEKTSTPPADDDKDLAEATELYPEVVNPLLKRIASLEKKLALVSDDVGDVKNVADRYQKTEQKTAEEKHWEDIRAKHPDVEDVVNSPEYADWYHNQAPMIQQALQQGTSRDVVAALNLYRADNPREQAEAEVKTPQTAAPRVDKLAAAKEASSPSIKTASKPEQKPTYTNAQIAKMSREEFMKHEAAIDEALARGEIK